MISIRWRLTFLLASVISLLFIATGVGVYIAMSDILEDRFDETLTAKARALITASEIDGGDFEIDLTVQDFAGFGRKGNDYFQIRRLDGSLFLRSPSLKGSKATGFERIRQPDGDLGVLLDGKLDGGQSARYYVQRIYPKDDKKDRFQDLYLIVASPTSSLQGQLGLLASVLALAGAVALLLMVPLIRVGLRSGLKPLKQFSNEINAIKPDDLSKRLAVNRLPLELVPVADGLNEWLARLEESFERERRFTSHAAHELRTPLAELKTIAELGAMAVEEATPGKFAEVVEVADELTHLLEKLALLSRADAGRLPVRLEEVDLHLVMDSAIARVAASAAERNLSWHREITPGSIQTDPMLYSTVVQNLLGNAVSHAPRGAEIQIVADASELIVRNLAPDLNDDDLRHLQERFWRKNESRSGYGHSGLGLAIVNSYVALLNGKTQLSLTSEGVLEVRVYWGSHTRSE